MEPIHLTSVDTKPQPSGRILYRIVAADGTIYATTDMWIAGLCQRAIETNVPVKLWSSGGWYYKNLLRVALISEVPSVDV